MKIKQIMKQISWITILFLAACSAAEAAPAGNGAADNSGANAAAVAVDDTAAAVEPVTLSATADGLTVGAQLAIGTLQLEESDLAVDDVQAAEMLPLWQAYQSLAASTMTAEAELNSVVNQIQQQMTAAQLNAIIGMELDGDDLAELLASGPLGMGSRGGGQSEGGDMPAGGGGRGGGIPGMGGGPGGGGGDVTTMDPEAVATQRAERMAELEGDAEAQLLAGAVVRLLQGKTGTANSPYAAMWTMLSEATGLDEEGVQTAVTAGTDLTPLITANGGDPEAVAAELSAMLAETPLAESQDLDQYVADLLAGNLTPPQSE